MLNFRFFGGPVLEISRGGEEEEGYVQDIQFSSWSLGGGLSTLH
jgi:hypothetical protein